MGQDDAECNWQERLLLQHPPHDAPLCHRSIHQIVDSRSDNFLSFAISEILADDRRYNPDVLSPALRCCRRIVSENNVLIISCYQSYMALTSIITGFPP